MAWFLNNDLQFLGTEKNGRFSLKNVRFSKTREIFVAYRETVRFSWKSWVSRQNRETWEVCLHSSRAYKQGGLYPGGLISGIIYSQGFHSHILIMEGGGGESKWFLWVCNFGQKLFFWVYERRQDFFGCKNRTKGFFSYAKKKWWFFWVDKFRSCDFFGYKIWTSVGPPVIKIGEWDPWEYIRWQMDGLLSEGGGGA